jgi:hypothetical protein
VEPLVLARAMVKLDATGEEVTAFTFVGHPLE